jgi:hypothetical protein
VSVGLSITSLPVQLCQGDSNVCYNALQKIYGIERKAAEPTHRIIKYQSINKKAEGCIITK